jgi:diaminohydroxyphosphoribosylaminopyrimidine deaminase / 5-amino-6-(5-phosphoribosylamino)uracil reductase
MLSDADRLLLQRSLQLAALGGSGTLPNPQVGAVVVQAGRIIGEGFHRRAGEPHAEVHAIWAVQDKSLLSQATLYVSLEPCSHHGRTPPCADLIVSHKIPRVVIGSLDPNPQVAGRGLERLLEAGIEVLMAPDPSPFERLNRSFFVNQRLKRPFLTLKWAESQDGYLAGIGPEGQLQPVALTAAPVNRWVHRLRAEHQSILVGRRTAAVDNPRLNTRHFPGPDPLRIVFDRYGRLDPALTLLSDRAPTLVLTDRAQPAAGAVSYLATVHWQNPKALFRQLYEEAGICSVLVEGGRQVLQPLLDSGLYDQALRFVSPKVLGEGLPAPKLPAGQHWQPPQMIGPDLLYQR